LAQLVLSIYGNHHNHTLRPHVRIADTELTQESKVTLHNDGAKRWPPLGRLWAHWYRK